MSLDPEALAASPKELARAGIARDFYRPGCWRCTPCRVDIQNGLTGAREHFDQVHLRDLHEVPPTLYVVA